MKPELLVTTERGGFPEKLHYGFIQIINEDYKHVYIKGDDNNTPFPFRSGAKPLQATAIIDSAAHRFFGINKQELAIICASHAGNPYHLSTIENILNKANLSVKDLKCGPHLPLDPKERELLIKQEKTATPLHNNCSGKHAGMLAVCAKQGWNTKNYLNPEHDLQKMIMKNVKKLCLLKDIPSLAIDGCSAPVPILAHYNMGVGFLNLFLLPEYKLLKTAMSENPFLIGGKGRLDSEIILASKGKLIAKVAAEGVCVVVNTDINQVLVVKISDADFKARSVIVIDVLQKFGWLSKKDVQETEGLKNLSTKIITNWQQEQVGEIKTFI